MPTIDLKVPQIGESVTSVFIAGWLKQVGESVQAGESIIEVDSDKASMEVPSPVSGVLTEQLCEEGDEVSIDAILGRIEEGAVGTATASAAPAESAAAESTDGDGVKAGPAARREAKSSGVDLGDVKGTGRKGNVTSADVRSAGAPAAAKPAASAPKQTDAQRTARTERVKMSPLRRTIARRLLEAKQTTAMLTTFNEVDMTGIMDLRKAYQERFVKKYGFKVGFMSFFVKATIEALKEFPAVNAEIDGNEIIYKNFYNVGVAVSTPRGLMVPVIRDVDQLSFAGIEAAIAEVAGRARDGKLMPDDFSDGTFTISNGGVFGSLMSTPILNLPQVGILGMHTIQRRPVAVGDEVQIRPMMYLAMSYDHRIIDGREAVSFLVRIKELVENPERLLLEI
ncbi:MAG: 2-oxoglutarate dehydrogenase complex dihydrolipoyllysine-residue succinyltransferase [Myxococcota bacterium]